MRFGLSLERRGASWRRLGASWARLEASGANYVTRGSKRGARLAALLGARGSSSLRGRKIFLKDIYIHKAYTQEILFAIHYVYLMYTLCMQLSVALCILYVYSLVQQPVLLNADTPLGSFGPGADQSAAERRARRRACSENQFWVNSNGPKLATK